MQEKNNKRIEKAISARFNLLIVLGLIAIVFGVYWNSFGNEFVDWDDMNLIVNNVSIRSFNPSNIHAIFTPSESAGDYRPIRTLSYALDFSLWGLEPFGYHLTNVICHAASVVLVYLIGYFISQNMLFAGLASVLFAVHPLNVEAVTWLSGRRDVLSLVFGMLSYYAFLRFLERKKFNSRSHRVLYAVSLLALILGVLTKQSVLVLPFLMLLYHVCFLSEKPWEAMDFLPYIPFFLVVFGFIGIYLGFAPSESPARLIFHSDSWYVTLLTMTRVFADYAIMFCVPVNLSTTYGIRTINSVFDLSWLSALVILLLLLLLCWGSWKKARVVSFGICWFFICLLPVSNIIPLYFIKADRFLYLPVIGLCLASAWGAVSIWKYIEERHKEHYIFYAGYWILIVVLFATFALLTIRRNRDWRDTPTLWTATLKTTPDSMIALQGLGTYYLEQQRFDEAISILQGIIENYENYPFYDPLEKIYYQLGRAYMAQQKYAKASEAFEHALESNSDFEHAYTGLAEVKIRQRDFETASGFLQKAIAANPENEIVYEQLGNLAFMQKQYAEAITEYQKAIDLRPLYIVPYNGLGLSYASLGEYEKAIEILQRALELDKDSVFLQKSLGSVYLRQGKLHEAISLFSNVLEHEPGNRGIRKKLADLFLQTSQVSEAAQEFETLLEQEPNNPELLSDLGIAYAQQNQLDAAVKAFRKALEQEPALLHTAVLLGDTCARQRDIDCAADAYHHALELAPDDRELREKLQKLAGE